MCSEHPYEILLVEDNASDAGLIRASLKVGLGAVAIRRVETLHDAINALIRDQFSVVLLDLNLPDSKGIETFQKLSENSNGTPIILLSSAADADTALAAVGAGADDYIQKKHFDAQTLARSVRFAVERNNRQSAERELLSVKSELTAAQHIQDSLYPDTAPTLPGLDIATGIRSAGIGCGDYFDFVTLKDGRALMVVGDVSGHGMASAMVMAETRACLRTLTDVGAETKQILPVMNRLICAGTSEGMFVTLLLLVFDPATSTFRYFNAGHPGWIVRSTERQQLVTHQLPLGLLSDLDYSASNQFTLNSNDILVIPTDGIAETPSGKEMFGNDRLLSCVEEHRQRSASDIVDEIFSAATNFGKADVPADDMTLLIVKAL